jgi:rubrerythrin
LILKVYIIIANSNNYHFKNKIWSKAMAKSLAGTKTLENLKAGFAGESQANRSYLYFARQADIEGYPDIAGVFRDTAEGETGHAFGHFDFLRQYGAGDPVTGEQVGDTISNLKSAIAGETYEYTEMYPGFAKTAREEGFDDIAEWFETLARAEKSHAGRFQKALESLTGGSK